MPSQLIRDLNPRDRPRERLLHFGPEALSDMEILSIILESGGRQQSALEVSGMLLKEFKNFKGILAADIKQLMDYKNIGTAKAVRIKAACEIALRLDKGSNTIPPIINKPSDVYDLVKKDLFGKKQEMLFLISLDSRNKFLSKDLVSIGTINETLIHPREIFKKALDADAVSIVLIHNHPSGDPKPSQEDIKVTERIVRAGVEIGINLLDHLIVTDAEFVSIKALNLLKKQ